MIFPVLRLIKRSLCWTSLGVGTFLNGLLIYLIIHHTPKEMKIYSKFYIKSNSGYNAAINDGLLRISNPDYRIWPFVATIFYVFMGFLSLFGCLAQFIYRYLVLNRDKRISLWSYFGILAICNSMPLLFCITMAFFIYPTADHAFLEDPQVAEMFDLDIRDNINLIIYLSESEYVVPAIAFSAVIICCTIAFGIIFSLAYLMRRHVQMRASQGFSSELQEKITKMNKQITLTLSILAFIPFCFYVSIVLVFGLAILQLGLHNHHWPWLPYYSYFLDVPMLIMSILNPIVAMTTIGHYRRVLISRIAPQELQ